MSVVDVSVGRQGRCLGLNWMPAGNRVCSFDCVYCPVRSTVGNGCGLHWPTPGAIGSALTGALHRSSPIDAIEIRGPGEPTLHPHFCAAVAEVVAAAGRTSPRPAVRIYTNGARATRTAVRRALALLDECVVRLDAAPERVNRPAARHAIDAAIQGLEPLNEIRVRSYFVGGGASNTDELSLRRWMDRVAELGPRRVDVVTIPWALARYEVQPVPTDQLEAIAVELRERVGVETTIQPRP